MQIDGFIDKDVFKKNRRLDLSVQKCQTRAGNERATHPSVRKDMQRPATNQT
jgi:hypothetical protein